MTPQNPEVETGTYQSGDERQILELFSETFLSQRSFAHWRWKFGANPYAAPLVGLARNEGRKLVGHYGTIPVPFHCAGQRKLIAQSVDTMVSPAYRGAGTFQAVAERCYEQANRADVLAVYGFPNEAAMPGRIKRLGWKRIAPLQLFVKRISFAPQLERWIRIRSLAKFVDSLQINWRIALMKIYLATSRQEPVYFKDTTPAGADSLWNECQAQSRFSLWKDGAYLRWRYDSSPDTQYQFYFVGSETAPLAITVVKWSGNSGEIAELLVSQRKLPVARHLLRHLSLVALERRVHWINFRGLDNGFFSQAFIGFKQSLSATDFFCGRILQRQDPALDGFYEAKHWTITAGDTDGV